MPNYTHHATSSKCQGTASVKALTVEHGTSRFVQKAESVGFEQPYGEDGQDEQKVKDQQLHGTLMIKLVLSFHWPQFPGFLHVTPVALQHPALTPQNKWQDAELEKTAHIEVCFGERKSRQLQNAQQTHLLYLQSLGKLPQLKTQLDSGYNFLFPS